MSRRRGGWPALAVLAAAACCSAIGAEPVPQQVPGWPRSFAEVVDPRLRDADAAPRREALLRSADEALDRGDSGAALAALEAAASMLHSADTEMRLVRTWLQLGEYRRALAFCAHTAGAHRDSAAPAALYAWLLSAGGQGAFAQRVLAEAALRDPQDAVVAQAGQQLAAVPAQATALLLNGPHRMAPHALMLGAQEPPPLLAGVPASAVLVDGGRRALVPSSAAAPGQRLWVRNGLGQTTAAQVEQRVDAIGVAVLSLDVPLDPGPDPGVPARDPFAGSPGFVAEYPATPDAAPAWPWLHAGFLGAQDSGSAPLRRVGIDLPPGPRGGPVLDAAGRLAGMVIKDAGGRDRMVPLSRLRDELDGLQPASAAAGPTGAAARIGADQAYERALRVALQLIVAP